MRTWRSTFSSWQVNGTVYVSVPFTWNIWDALRFAKEQTKKVVIGGPAVKLMPDYVMARLPGHATIQDSIDGIEPVTTHNPFATFTSRGCISKCSFCAVPVIEGPFKEVPDFIPRPIVCDNNFLASSTAHFNKAVDKLKGLPIVDFNQGLDCALFKSDKAQRLTELKIKPIRFSFDSLSRETPVIDAIRYAKKLGFSQITIYLLYGFNHTLEESVYMGDLLRKEKVSIYPMRYNPLNAMCRNEFVPENMGWDHYSLQAFQRCYFATKIPFNEFRNQVKFIGSDEDSSFNLV